MPRLKDIKPVYIYLTGAICFIVSRQFETLPVLNYGFAAVGGVLIFLAIRKYFRK